MEQPNQVHETALCSDHLSHTDVGHTAPFQVAASVQTQALAAIAPQGFLVFPPWHMALLPRYRQKRRHLDFRTQHGFPCSAGNHGISQQFQPNTSMSWAGIYDVSAPLTWVLWVLMELQTLL